MTVSVSQCITHLNAYGYPECISQPILDNKTITLGETGGIVSLDLSKSKKGLVHSAPEAPPSTPRKPLPVPTSSPGHGNIQTRFPKGSAARSEIDYQLGPNCVGKICCFRGSRCDGSMGAECGHAASTSAADIARTKAMLRQRFLTKNPCVYTSSPCKQEPLMPP